MRNMSECKYVEEPFDGKARLFKKNCKWEKWETFDTFLILTNEWPDHAGTRYARIDSRMLTAEGVRALDVLSREYHDFDFGDDEEERVPKETLKMRHFVRELENVSRAQEASSFAHVRGINQAYTITYSD
jgi:hypothetical protein